MGPLNAAWCLASYLKEKMRPSFKGRQNDSFESWAVDRFWRRLFEMFFRSYSEKLWGISCQDLKADFAAQRIKRFSLGEAVEKRSMAAPGNKHRTLVDRFAYPLHGTGSVYAKMAKRCANAADRSICDPPWARRARRFSDPRGRTGRWPFRAMRSRDFHHAADVAGAPPGAIPDHVRAAIDALKFRNTVLVYLHVDAKALFRDQWLYIHSPELQMGRVTNFRNWVPELYGDRQTTILAIEYWCYDTDPLWTEDAERTIDRATREMR